MFFPPMLPFDPCMQCGVPAAHALPVLAGLLAWIVEKFHTWTDCDGNLEAVLTKDELLTNVCLYW